MRTDCRIFRVLLVALAAGLSACASQGAGSPEPRVPSGNREAIAHRSRAIELARTGHDVEAVVEFEAAYRLDANAANAYNLGVAYANTDQPARAVEMLKRYLAVADPKIRVPTRDEVRAEIVRNEALIPTEAPNAAALPTPAPSNEARVNELPRREAPISKTQPRYLTYGAGGLAAAAAGFATVFYLDSAADVRARDRACPLVAAGGSCPTDTARADYEAKQSSAEHSLTTARVFTGVGAGLLITACTLWFVEPKLGLFGAVAVGAGPMVGADRRGLVVEGAW